MKRGVYSIIIVSIFLSKRVYGYIDPGAGSAIAGSLWPLIMAISSAIAAFIVRYFWKPIKKCFGAFFGAKNENKTEK